VTAAISDRQGRRRLCWSNAAQLGCLPAKVQSADQESQDNLMPLVEELHGYYLS
jgi:hypothetical protein